MREKQGETDDDRSYDVSHGFYPVTQVINGGRDNNGPPFSNRTRHFELLVGHTFDIIIGQIPMTVCIVA